MNNQRFRIMTELESESASVRKAVKDAFGSELAFSQALKKDQYSVFTFIKELISKQNSARVGIVAPPARKGSDPRHENESFLKTMEERFS